jgi:hypothetical protein
MSSVSDVIGSIYSLFTEVKIWDGKFVLDLTISNPGLKAISSNGSLNSMKKMFWWWILDSHKNMYIRNVKWEKKTQWSNYGFVLLMKRITRQFSRFEKRGITLRMHVPFGRLVENTKTSFLWRSVRYMRLVLHWNGEEELLANENHCQTFCVN